MFGADTSLVIDALQMVGLAVVATGGAVWFFLSRRNSTNQPVAEGKAGDLEDRVRVLERIATDRSIDLADEIESLRTTDKTKEMN
ncbi:MAG: hypothetical protein HKP43_04890 [Altererythrobacter sp.]|nr:hypothetical protein [Altererythrobacter sp.]NNF95097.1 hypothetical protein [Altererythrobacter sp.]NNK45949.1 hypothetical protein [Altererythrobacter sp.]